MTVWFRVFAVGVLIALVSTGVFAQKSIFVRVDGNDANDGLTVLTAKLTVASAIESAAANDNDVIDIGPGNFAGAVFAKDVIMRGANANAGLAVWGDETVITSVLDYGNATVSVEGIAFNVISPVVSTRYINISNCKFRESNTIALSYGVNGFEVRVVGCSFDGNLDNGGGVTVGPAISVSPDGAPNMCDFAGLMSLTVLETTFEDYMNSPISAAGYKLASIKNNEFTNCNSAETGTVAAVSLSPFIAACAPGLMNAGVIGDAFVTNNRFEACRNAVRVFDGNNTDAGWEQSSVSYNLFNNTPAGFYALWVDKLSTDGAYNSFGAQTGDAATNFGRIRDIIRGHGAYGPFMLNAVDVDPGAVGFQPDWNISDAPVVSNSIGRSFFTIQAALASNPGAGSQLTLFAMEYDVTSPPSAAGIVLNRSIHFTGQEWIGDATTHTGPWPTIRGSITVSGTWFSFSGIRFASLTQTQLDRLTPSARPTGVTMLMSNSTSSLSVQACRFDVDPVATLTTIPTAGAIVINREGDFWLSNTWISRPVSVGPEAAQFIRAITFGSGNGSRNFSVSASRVEGTIQISGMSLLSSASITNCVIDNAGVDGITFLGNTVRDAYVGGNTISNSRQNGISIRDRVTVGTNSATFENNLITGSGASGSSFAAINIANPSYGVQSFVKNALFNQSGTNKAFINSRPSYTPIATCNWWGSSSEDDIINLITGSVAYDDGVRGWSLANTNQVTPPASGYYPAQFGGDCSVRSFSISLAASRSTCFGSATGSITTTLSGVSDPNPATYAWTRSGGGFTSTAQNPTNLAAGTYAVAVTSVTGNLRRSATVIVEPTQLTGSLAAIAASCNGTADGGIKILNAAGGLIPNVITSQTYNYRLDNISGTIGDRGQQASETFTNVAAGTYDAYVISAGVSPTCEVMVGTIEVEQPVALNASVSKSNVSCFAANNGSITVSNPTGGLLPGSTATMTYQYRLDHLAGTAGDRAPQGSGAFIGLIPGTYDVYVIAVGVTPTCERRVSSVTIFEPSELSASVGKSNSTCFAANNGTITLSMIGGGTHPERITQSYSYRIDRLGTTIGDVGPQVGTSFGNLAPGVYEVFVIATGVTPVCEVRVSTQTILEPSQLVANVSKANITCFGANNGSITLSGVAGGVHAERSTQAYSYRIDRQGSTAGDAGPQAGTTFSSLIPGAYDVYVIATGVTPTCEVLVSTQTILEPLQLSGTASKTNITCNGANDGTIQVSAAAGGTHAERSTQTYTYRIDRLGSTVGDAGPQASATFANLIPGTYDVFVIATGVSPACERSISTQTILEPSVLSASVAKTNITCNGANNGTISISGATGGTHSERPNQTYTYRIDRQGSTNGDAGPQSGTTFSNLIPGVYDVYVIASGTTPVCEVKVSTQTIHEPSVLNALVTKSNISCNAANDGTITISGTTGGVHAERGSQNYSYRIDRQGTTVGDAGPQASATFTGLIPGAYDVYVIATGVSPTCEVLVSTQVILEPLAVNATGNKTNLSCNNANDGTITVDAPTGGTHAEASSRTFQYMINRSGNITGPQPTGTFAGLVPGTYTVSVVALATGSSPACTTFVFSVIIQNPSSISATVAKTNMSCNNVSDGSITISNPLGGTHTETGPTRQSYQFMLGLPGGGNTPSQASGSFTNLGPGSYTAFVIALAQASSPACTTNVGSYVINNPTPVLASVSKSNLSCFAANNGTITVTNPTGGTHADAGTRTYQYMISRSGGATTAPQASGSFSSLVPGTYIVSVITLASGSSPICTTAVSTQTILEPSVLSASVNKTNVTCFGANNGTISLSNTQGGTHAERSTQTYSYRIDRQGGVSGDAGPQSGTTFSGLIPGVYDVYVIASGITPTCELLVSTQTILEPLQLTASVSKTNITCNAANDGTISLTSVSGGTHAERSSQAYTYRIDRLGGTSGDVGPQAGATFAGLIPGVYDVYLIASGISPTCEIKISTQTIFEPSAISGSATKANVTCNGANNGTITVTSATGGTHDERASQLFAYRIDRIGSTTGDAGPQAGTGFTNLIPGTYDVFAIATGVSPTCEVKISTQTILEPTVLSANVNRTNPTCTGANNGSITVSGANGGLITGVILSQTYTYRIDRLGSTVGDVGPQASGSFPNLGPGTYDVYVIASGISPACEVMVSAQVIADPAPIASNPQVTSNYNGAQLSCPNSSDGSLAANASGGTPGYTYLWEKLVATVWTPVGTTATISNQSAGSFRVRVTDVNGCMITNPVSLVAPPQTIIVGATKLSYNGQDISCFGASDGQITVNANGGTQPLRFSRDNGVTWQASNIFTGLPIGTFTMIVSDVNGCPSLPLAVTITQPTEVVISSLTQNGPVNATLPIEFTVVTSGGTQRSSGTKYTYSWATPRTAAQIPVIVNETGTATATARFTIAATTADDNGQYTVTVTDANGCQKTSSSTIIVYPSTLYVSTTGNDATGDGRLSNPLRTIQKANDVALAANTIEVLSGTFNESPVISKQLSVNGTATTTLGSGGYFIYGTTSVITWGANWPSSTWNNIGVNGNGSGALQTAYNKVNGGSGNALWFIGSHTIGATLTVGKELALRGATSTAAIPSYTGCDVEPPATISFTGTGADSVLFKFTGSMAKSMRDLTLKIPFAGKFAMVDVGSTGDVTPVENMRFEWDNNNNTADGYRRIYGVTNGAFSATEKFDVAKFINDGADVGFGGGRVIFGANGPLPWTALSTGWKAEDGGYDVNLSKIRTLEPMKSDVPLQNLVSTTRRPSLNTTGTAYNSKWYLSFDDALTQHLEGNKSEDIIGGDQKTLFVVFRPLVNTTEHQVVYKHGDDDEGMSIVHLKDGRISLNIYNGTTNTTRESWIYESGATHSSAGFDDEVLIAQIYFNGNGNLNADRRVGASLDRSSGRVTTEVNHTGADKTNGYVANTAFTSFTLTTPAVAGAANVTSMGARSGSMYYASWDAAALPPVAVNNAVTTTGRSLFYKGSIAEVLILNDASIAMRDASYCYLRNKYFSGNQTVENGLDKRVVAGDERALDESLLAWPNPADQQLSFEAVVPYSGEVTVTLRDALGKVVRVLFEEHVQGGTIIPVTRQIEDVATGFYMLHLEGAGEVNKAIPVVIRH
jgi:hypothetical protein